MPYYCNNKECKSYLREFPVCDIGIEFFTAKEWAAKMDREKRCPNCLNSLKYEPVEFLEVDAPSIAKFGSFSSEDKRKVINKRASAAMKKDGFHEKKSLKRKKIINDYYNEQRK